MFIGRLFYKIYVWIHKLRFIRQIENKYGKTLFNILDDKLFGGTYKNSNIDTSTVVKVRADLKKYDNSSYYKIKFNKVIIHYREFFPNNKIKSKLFLIHGFGANTSYYDLVVPYLLKEDYYVVLIDLPGWGLSSKSLIYSQDVRGLEIKELLNYLDNKNNNSNDWIGIGHSMGGGTILNMNYDKIKLKILLSPAVEPIMHNLTNMMFNHLDHFINLVTKRKIFINNIIGFASYDKIDKNIYDRFIEQLPDSKTITKTIIEGFETNNLVNKNRDIQIYILWSTEDTIIGNARNNDLYKLPNVHTFEIKGSHLYTLTHPKETSDFILNSINNIMFNPYDRA